MSTSFQETMNRAFQGFSGADCIFTLNGIPIPEAMDINYREHLHPRYDEQGNQLPPIEGKLVQTLVGGSEPIIRDLMTHYKDQLIVFIANEYGQRASVSFEDAFFYQRVGGLSVGDASIHETYLFRAERCVFLTRPWIINEHGKYEFAKEEAE